MPLEWEETHPLSREIKEVMLSVFCCGMHNAHQHQLTNKQRVRMQLVCLRGRACIRLRVGEVVQNY